MRETAPFRLASAQLELMKIDSPRTVREFGQHVAAAYEARRAAEIGGQQRARTIDRLRFGDRLTVRVAIAREVPVQVVRASAGDFLAALSPVEGTWTVVWHSVMWMYLDDAERGAVLAHLDRAGADAGERSPLAHIAFEAPALTADSGIGFEIRVRTWPGGAERVLGHGPAHGLPIEWD